MKSLLVLRSPETPEGAGNGATPAIPKATRVTDGPGAVPHDVTPLVHAVIQRHQADLRAVGEEIGAKVVRALRATLLAPDSGSTDVLHRAVAHLDEGERTRLRTTLSSANPAAAMPAANAARFPKLKLSAAATALITQIGEEIAAVPAAPMQPAPAPEPWRKKIQFHWEKVTCSDDSSEAGPKDELLIWGIGLGPFGEVSTSAIFGPYKLAGAESYAAGPKLLAELSLTDDLAGKAPWPQSYECVVVLGEQDKGGFVDMIKEIWDAIGKQVSQLITVLVSAGIGLAVGAALGTHIVPIIGSLVGAAIGAIIGFLVGLLNDPDDVLGAATWTVTLQSNTQAHLNQVTGGDGKSDLRTLKYAAKGGRWSVRARWRVV